MAGLFLKVLRCMCHRQCNDDGNVGTGPTLYMKSGKSGKITLLQFPRLTPER